MRNLFRYALVLLVLVAVSAASMALTQTPSPTFTPSPTVTPSLTFTPAPTLVPLETVLAPIPTFTPTPFEGTFVPTPLPGGLMPTLPPDPGFFPTPYIPGPDVGEVLEVGGVITDTGVAYNPMRRVLFRNEVAGQVVVFRLTPTLGGGSDLYPETYGSIYATYITRTDNTYTFLFPFVGDYPLVVNVYSPDPTNNSYTLSATTPETREVELGENFDVTLSSEVPVALMSFEGQAQEQVVVNASSDVVLPSFVLLPEVQNGFANPIYDSTSAYYGAVQSYSSFTLPQDGRYILVLSSAYLPQAATFDVFINTTSPTLITYSEEIEGELTTNQPYAFYNFEGKNGDVIDVRVITEGSVDTVLSISDVLGGQFGFLFDDDSGPDYDPEIIRQPIYQDGTYTIRVQSFVRGAEGRYRLIVTRNEGYDLDAGTQVVSLDKRPDLPLSFEAEAGEEITLNVRSINGPIPFVNVFQGNIVLLTLGSSSPDVTELSVDFIVPEDGRVLVRLDRNYQVNVPISSVVEVSIER
ncbi:MAG: hypothetical protein OHK0046_40540 [Anaerolineae bacterium]